MFWARLVLGVILFLRGIKSPFHSCKADEAAERDETMSAEAQEQQKQVVQNTETDTSVLTPKSPAGKKNMLPVIGIAILAVVMAVAGIGIYAYNTPANRLNRLLDLGEKYLSEMNYEQAAVVFQDALEIEPSCLQAYAGGIEAYKGLDDTASLQIFYQNAVDTMTSMDNDTFNENMELAINIFIQAGDVYKDKPKDAADIIELGYDLTDHDKRIIDPLVEIYEILVDIYQNDGDYDKELDIYDKILEVQPDNEDALHNRSERLEAYLELLISTGDVDKAEELIRKYQDVIDDVDFEKYISQVATLKEQIAIREDLLKRAYELMAAEDYVAMTEIDGSDEARAVAEALNGAPGIYTPDGFTEDYTGVAVGIYPYEYDNETDHYFYYGNFVNGIREGHGIRFGSSSTHYSIYDGPWQNDSPNGEGAYTTYNRQSEDEEYGSYCIMTETGNFTNGLHDGEFTRILNEINHDFSFTGSYIADNGQVSDVWDQYPQYHHYERLYNTHMNGDIIFVILENNTDSNWDNYIWWYTISPEKKLGIVPWIY